MTSHPYLVCYCFASQSQFSLFIAPNTDQFKQTPNLAKMPPMSYIWLLNHKKWSTKRMQRVLKHSIVASAKRVSAALVAVASSYKRVLLCTLDASIHFQPIIYHPHPPSKALAYGHTTISQHFLHFGSSISNPTTTTIWHYGFLDKGCPDAGITLPSWQRI